MLVKARRGRHPDLELGFVLSQYHAANVCENALGAIDGRRVGAGAQSPDVTFQDGELGARGEEGGGVHGALFFRLMDEISRR